MSVLRFLQPKIKAMSNGLFANWMPTNQVEVGDYGIVANGQFERLGTLRDYGATFDVEDAPGSSSDLEYKDKLELSVSALAEAGAGAGKSAKVTLAMKDKGSFLYHLANARQLRPTNTRQFHEEVARALLAGGVNFPKGGVLISEVQVADKATIIVSEGKEGHLELDTAFKPTGTAFLSGASGKISTAMSRGSLLQWIARDRTTSLIKIVIPKISPSGGPGTGMAMRTVQAIKDWMQERRVGASHLRITYDPQVAAGTIIAFDGQEDQFSMELEDLSATDLLSTIAELQPEEAVDEDVFTMDIEEEEVGEHYRTANG